MQRAVVCATLLALSGCAGKTETVQPDAAADGDGAGNDGSADASCLFPRTGITGEDLGGPPCGAAVDCEGHHYVLSCSTRFTTTSSGSCDCVMDGKLVATMPLTPDQRESCLGHPSDAGSVWALCPFP